MKKYISIILIFLSAILSAQSTNQNYVLTNQYLVSGVESSPLILDGQYNSNVTYLDGLGRPIQYVEKIVQSGRTGKGIVQHIEYDVYGRQIKEYLPYVQSTGSNAMLFDANALTNTHSYYNTVNYENTLNPYSEKVLENSPLSRPLKQGAPGNSWKIENGNDHTIKTEYSVNKEKEVKWFKSTLTWDSFGSFYQPQLSLINDYPQNTLYKSIIKDENWVPGSKDHTVEEFKNQKGEIVLKRTYLDDNPVDTYYVYDQFGHLSFVLPPLLNNIMGSGNFSQSQLDDLAYQYVYDKKNRLVEKKLPGKTWEFIIYDIYDRVYATGPVMAPFQDIISEDTSIENKQGFMISKYDILGRVAYTAWLKDDKINREKRINLQNYQEGIFFPYVYRYDKGITINGVKIAYKLYNRTPDVYESDYDVLTINYYDDYKFTDVTTWVPAELPTTILNQTVYYNNSITPKGLLTGTWVRILENKDNVNAELGYILYDRKGNVLRNFVRNHMHQQFNTQIVPGFTQIDNKYDFVNRVTQTQTQHRKNMNTELININELFTYNKKGQITKHTHQINDLPVELLVKNDYDDLGQLIASNVGGQDLTGATCLEKVDYTYNIRGWLKGINQLTTRFTTPTKLFAFKINYDQVANYSGQVAFGENYSSKPLYNGNISETYWQSKSSTEIRKYTYNYDALNRLTDAYYIKPNNIVKATNAYNEHLAYDVNGNITHLLRTGSQDLNTTNSILIDDINYQYNGNQLINTHDDTLNEDGFKDGNEASYTQLDDYQYDHFGNMLLDRNKGSIAISYNHLNLPTNIEKPTGGHELSSIIYDYNAAGSKLRKDYRIFSFSASDITDYLQGFQYKNGKLQFFPTSQGYVAYTDGQYNYVYNYKDHLGNTRLSYTFDPATSSLKVLEQSNYYPFGLQHEGYSNNVFDFFDWGFGLTLESTSQNRYKYKYNGKEYQDELELNVYDYHNRTYDPAIARWWQIDPMAEQGRRWSPYNYAMNNPIYFIDPDGMWPDNPIKGLLNRVKHEVKSYVSNKVNNVVSSVKNYVGQKRRELINAITPNNPFTKSKPEKAEKGSGYGVNFTVEGGKEGAMTTPQGDRDVQSEDMTTFMTFATDVFGPETKLPGVAPDGSNPLNGETKGEAATESTMSTATSSEDQMVTAEVEKYVATDIPNNTSQVARVGRRDTLVEKSQVKNIDKMNENSKKKAQQDSDKINGF